MSNQSRVPEGVPTGGQFAASAKAEAEVSLTGLGFTSDEDEGAWDRYHATGVVPDGYQEDPDSDGDLIRIEEPSADHGPYSDEAYEAPLSREEIAAVWDKDIELRRLEAADAAIRLADGSRVEVVGHEIVGTIVENGEYFVTHPDGETSVHPFEDLPGRAEVARKIAETAARDHRADRAVQDARLKASNDSDPMARFNALREADRVAGLRRAAEYGISEADLAAEEADLARAHRTEARIVAKDEEYEHPLFGKVIHSYTRAQALNDGVVIDHTELAAEAGIKWPVALTTGAQADAITWTRGDAGQDETGRAWDVFNQCRRALTGQGNRSVKSGERIPFQVLRVPNQGRGQQPRLTTLHAVVGPDDHGKPCITIMTPDED